MSKLNISKNHQTRDGYPVRYIGMTDDVNDPRLIWGTHKPDQNGGMETIFRTRLDGTNITGLSQFWEVIPVPVPPVTKYLWVSTAQFMDSQPRSWGDTSKWYDDFPNTPSNRAIIEPGSIWYECQIDTETGEILSMKVMTQ